ncbi:MAG: ABC transporter substrate-binding protein [Anaerolineae bacterium]|nr:ABC transporter substrate-binding protein [Anaerolineae bacterium]
MKKLPVTPKEMEAIHPYIPEAFSKLEQGKISRREFLRLATLLGMHAGLATVIAACSSGGSNSSNNGNTVSNDNTSGQTTETTAPTTTSRIKRGGTWTCSMQLQLLDHPARLSWVEGANIVRQVCEYLTETGSDNITRPLLLDRWAASDDLLTWDLFLKRGIKFNNGDEFQADDVLFTFGEWLNEDIGSSMLGLLSYLDGTQSVEKIDDYQVRLHLNSPQVAVPENLFHYPAVILHRNFEGDIVRQPVGTGPFLLQEYAEAERAVFVRREDYWQNGEDGSPLPYLNQLIFVSTDKDAGVAALQSGQVDSLYDPRPGDWQALKDNPNLAVRSVGTAQSLILRMRVDLEPWNDNRVRTALKMCQDRARILQLAYFGEGDLSIDAHVAPIQPEYAEKPIPPYNPDGARALLEEYAAEKGISLPLRVTLATKNDQNEPEIAQTLKQLAEPAGFDITLDITEPNGYWARWTEVDLGITSWTHRPVAVMLLPLAYTREAIGNWNETRWVDDEFEAKLRQAQGTLDIEARRAIMSDIEDIMQERGPIGNSFWKSVWNITHRRFQNVQAHPTAYYLMADVWEDA